MYLLALLVPMAAGAQESYAVLSDENSVHNSIMTTIYAGDNPGYFTMKEEGTGEWAEGDLNHDGGVNAADIVVLVNMIMNQGIPNSFQNKKISILGNSISTFKQEGYMIPGYRMYYPRPSGSTDKSVDVRTVDDTWWKKVIDRTNSYLEVNASWSGSCASNRRQSDGYPNFVDRVNVLGNPDIIFIELGSNDSGWGVDIGEIDFNAETYDLSKFAPAYIKGIQTIIKTYPKAKIICLAFKMKKSYEDVIRTVANHYKLSFISLRDLHEETHPCKEEMQNVANRIINLMVKLNM